MTERPDPMFDEAERRALAAALEPLPLDEARVRTTMQLAQRDLQRRRARKQLMLVSLVAVIGVLLGSGYWRWSGMRSADLSLRQAMDITLGMHDHDTTGVGAAHGKVWKDLVRVIALLKERGQLSARMRDQVVQCIDSATPVAVAYERGFEEICWKLVQGEVISPAEIDDLQKAMCAGIHAIRVLGQRDQQFLRSTQLMCTHLRQDLMATGAASAPKRR